MKMFSKTINKMKNKKQYIGADTIQVQPQYLLGTKIYPIDMNVVTNATPIKVSPYKIR